MGTAPGTDRDKDTRTPVVGAAAQVRTAARVRIAVRTVQGARLQVRHSDSLHPLIAGLHC